MSDPEINPRPDFNPPPASAEPAAEEKGPRPLNFACRRLFSLFSADYFGGRDRQDSARRHWHRRGLRLLGHFAFCLELYSPAADHRRRRTAAVRSAKTAGIFYEPTRVFRNLRAHPYWLAAFLVVGIVNVVYSTAFVQRLTPERIVELHDGKARGEPDKASAGANGTSEGRCLQQAKQPIQRVQTAAKSFVGLFVFACFRCRLLSCWECWRSAAALISGRRLQQCFMPGCRSW